MKPKKEIISIIILTICIISCNPNLSTNGNKKATSPNPIEFGKQFSSVCKVGLRGGDGTLIGNNWVLTAAHVGEGMFKQTNGDLYVYFENGDIYKVKQVFLHPKYEPMGKYDLALLELESSVDEIEPIKIYSRSDELNKEIIIAGHGNKRAADNSWIKDGKLRAYTNIIDDVNNTQIIFDYDSPDNEATEQEGTSGPGDSGGPAFISKNSELYLVGVSSMGEPGRNGPATYGAVEYFVRVSKFHNWIKQTIENPNSTKSLSINEDVTNVGESIQWSDSNQALHAKLFVNALENYSRQKMIDVVKNSFDPYKLKQRSAEKITEMMLPNLIHELQGARIIAIQSESSDRISLELTNNKNLYGLDIFFNPTSKKIEQIAYGKFD